MSATPSRRTVLATSGWAVPAVVLASAAPAFAGSGGRVGVMISAVCDGISGYAQMRIAATGPDPIPAGTIVSTINAGRGFYTELPGYSRENHWGKTSAALSDAIPVGSYATLYFGYRPEEFPTPSMTLTLPAGHAAAPGSILTGSTRGDACETP